MYAHHSQTKLIVLIDSLIQKVNMVNQKCMNVACTPKKMKKTKSQTCNFLIWCIRKCMNSKQLANLGKYKIKTKDLNLP